MILVKGFNVSGKGLALFCKTHYCLNTLTSLNFNKLFSVNTYYQNNQNYISCANNLKVLEGLSRQLKENSSIKTNKAI